MDQARLIIDPPAEGSWNMAVDQALLETADQTGSITLRFYQWAEPTLSLGYFQKYDDRRLHPASLNCPIVRRRTGGGAIMHDQELTYSLCVPSTNRWSTKNSELYETMHQIIINLLNEHGGDAALYRDRAGQIAVASESAAGEIDESTDSIVDQRSFMCFRRRSPGDVVLGGHKIVGSAQRRVKNALLQHGSILLATSPFSPELTGIRELCGFPLPVQKTIEKLSDGAENRLRVKLNAGKLSQLEMETANGARSTLFNNQQWITRR